MAEMPFAAAFAITLPALSLVKSSDLQLLLSGTVLLIGLPALPLLDQIYLLSPWLTRIYA